jgi:hypothetical protein
LGKAGLYIVAFRSSFEKCFNLIPLVVVLFCGFIFCFDIKVTDLNEKFLNSSIPQNIAEMGIMLLAIVDDIEKLGIKSTAIITTFIVFGLFILLIPILLANLLIGASTGQLEEVIQNFIFCV